MFSKDRAGHRVCKQCIPVLTPSVNHVLLGNGVQQEHCTSAAQQLAPAGHSLQRTLSRHTILHLLYVHGVPFIWRAAIRYQTVLLQTSNCFIAELHVELAFQIGDLPC